MNNFQKKAYIFIFFSTIIRLILASLLELGNDEVYYWLYAKYPAVSHFDHPPMVGFFIQLFTCNLYFDSAFFIRLAAIIPSSLSMVVIFLIGKEIYDSKIGFISVLLYNLSIYGFIISGMFILPDSPMVLFWLLSILFFLKSLIYNPTNQNKKYLLVAFLFCSLAIYSKYQAIYLLLGVILYVIFYNRTWLRSIHFYISFLFPCIAIGLIFYWNYQNDFISFSFHNKRVSLFSFTFNKDSFLREVLGQIIYNNPYVFGVIVLMIISFFKKKFVFNRRIVWFFLLFSAPLLITTIYLSTSRSTLPHWSGISYLTLIPIASIYVFQKKKIIKKLYRGFIFLVVLFILASCSINYGFLMPKPNTSDSVNNLGRKDVTMDMYGWRQAADSLHKIILEKNLGNYQIVSDNWYPASHIDYYIASLLKMNVYVLGDISKKHKYHWINQKNKLLKNKVLYVTDSRNYKDPILFKKEYPVAKLLNIIEIKRNNVSVKNVFLYLLEKRI